MFVRVFEINTKHYRCICHQVLIEFGCMCFQLLLSVMPFKQKMTNLNSTLKFCIAPTAVIKSSLWPSWLISFQC